MRDPAHILVIDDELSVCTLLKRYLEKKGFLVTIKTNGTEALQALKLNKFDLIISDYFLEEINGKDLLQKILKLSPDACVIFITGYADVRMAVDLMKEGAFHYLSKPIYPEEILEIIKKALASKCCKDQQNPIIAKEAPILTKRSKIKTSYNLDNNQKYMNELVLGNSAPSKKLFEEVSLVANTNISVIIFGETGTGKEVVAKLLHQQSKRKDKVFIPIDCGSLSKELAASELFGHLKGAFTGALSDKIGAFESAHNGTVFLDEIGNLSMDVQMYLLRALQERTIRRVGAVDSKEINVRVIVATNENLADCVKEGRFREDLYHRLNEFTIHVPSLRERYTDLPEFINFFISKSCEELEKDVLSIDNEALQVLMNYQWPGNIRELGNVIKRACLLTKANESISINTLPPEVLSNCELEHSEIKDSKDLAPLKKVSLEAELQEIKEVLKNVNNNKSAAARVLQIDRKTLYNKLDQLKELEG